MKALVQNYAPVPCSRPLPMSRPFSCTYFFVAASAAFLTSRNRWKKCCASGRVTTRNLTNPIDFWLGFARLPFWPPSVTSGLAELRAIPSAPVVSTDPKFITSEIAA